MDDPQAPGTVDQVLDGFPIPRIRGKDTSVRNGDLFYIDRSTFLSPLPQAIRNLVEEYDYSARYYAFPPVQLASVIETFLSINVKKNCLNEYNSSIKKKMQLRGNLVYYAVSHVIRKLPTIELVGVNKECKNELSVWKEDEDEISVIIVYSHDVTNNGTGDNGSVVLIASKDIMKWDAWIDSINDMYEQKKLPRMTIDGRRGTYRG